MGPGAEPTLLVSPSRVVLSPGETAGVRAEIVAVDRSLPTVGAVLRVDALPPGVRADSVTVPGGERVAFLLLEADAEAGAGSSEARVEAALLDGELLRAPLGVEVASGRDPAGGFSLALRPSPLSIRPGQTDTVRVTVRRDPPFSGSVRLAVRHASPGVSTLVEPARVGGTEASLIVDVDASAPLGDAGLTLVGQGEGVPDDTVRLVLTTFGEPFPDLPPTTPTPPT